MLRPPARSFLTALVAAFCLAFLGAHDARAQALRLVEVWPDGPAPFVEVRVDEPSNPADIVLRLTSASGVTDVPLGAFTRGAGARIVIAGAEANAFGRWWQGANGDERATFPGGLAQAGSAELVRTSDAGDETSLDRIAWPADARPSLVGRGLARDEGGDDAWIVTGVATPGAASEGLADRFVVEGNVRVSAGDAASVVTVARDAEILARVNVVDGVFRSEGLPPTADIVQVSLRTTRGLAAQQEVSLDGQNARADFFLDGVADVTVIVNGSGEQDVIVELEGATRERQVGVREDGRFAFPGLLPGTWSYRVEVFGFAIEEGRVLVDGATEVVVDLRPLTTARLDVQAVLADGRGATTARLRLEGLGPRADEPVRDAVAGQGGRARFDAVPVGPWRLVATYEGGRTVVSSVEILADTSIVVRIPPRNDAPSWRTDSVGCASSGAPRGTGFALLALLLAAGRRRRGA